MEKGCLPQRPGYTADLSDESLKAAGVVHALQRDNVGFTYGDQVRDGRRGGRRVGEAVEFH